MDRNVGLGIRFTHGDGGKESSGTAANDGDFSRRIWLNY
jgi:hypothetical protein